LGASDSDAWDHVPDLSVRATEPQFSLWLEEKSAGAHIAAAVSDKAASQNAMVITTVCVTGSGRRTRRRKGMTVPIRGLSFFGQRHLTTQRAFAQLGRLHGVIVDAGDLDGAIGLTPVDTQITDRRVDTALLTMTAAVVALAFIFRNLRRLKFRTRQLDPARDLVRAITGENASDVTQALLVPAQRLSLSGATIERWNGACSGTPRNRIHCPAYHSEGMELVG
jgi:hypothetical protein